MDLEQRPTVSEIEKNLLVWWSELKENKDTEFTQQVKDVEKLNKTLPILENKSIFFESKKYTSELLVDFTKLDSNKIEMFKVEKLQTQIEQPPKSN